MKQLAFLEYAFIFDPETTWSNVYDFEDKLAEVLRAQGLEAKIVTPIRGHSGRGLLFITRIENDLLNNPSKSFEEAARLKEKEKIANERKRRPL